MLSKNHIGCLVAVWIIFAGLAASASFATCTGSDPCKACKNCKYCKHCAKDGGSCGICKRSMIA